MFKGKILIGIVFVISIAGIGGVIANVVRLTHYSAPSQNPPEEALRAEHRKMSAPHESFARS